MTTKARRVNQLHHEAMEFADESFVARLEKDRARYLHFTRLALEKEVAAADLMVDEDVEPTRSVLHRSAATLAWRCEEYDRAKRLVYRALLGNPPREIEHELKELLGDIKLAEAGIYLGERQLQFSLNGKEVGYGNASVTELATRESSIRRMLNIAAKAAVRHFHDFSDAKLKDFQDVVLYLDGIYPGSCNVSLRLAEPIQNLLPGFEQPDEIIAPFLENLKLIDRGEYDLLEEKIADPSDFRDFVNAAIRLAPDGDKISTVKFQTRVGDQVHAVSLSRAKGELSEIQLPELPDPIVGFQATEKDIEKKGILRVADALGKTECVLVTDNDTRWSIEGPESTMDEIVRAYFKRRVQVKGKRMKKRNLVDRIWLDGMQNITMLNGTNENETTGTLALTLL